MTFPIRQLEAGAYPPLLKEIPDAPPLLYIRGELSKREHKLLCVVGSRATSIYGRRAVMQILSGLARYPITIVSGLAIGIDAEAHAAALDAGMHTIAVLPSSCDDESIYPSMNRSLARKILEKGGALISERKAPSRPRLYDFPARNRIMAGMSHATLIIEASEKSGTLITARLALDYNRDVLAIPHELGKEIGAGANRLIREGATLVRSSEDVLEALGLRPLTSALAPLPSDLTDAEAEILRALSEPLMRDELAGRITLTVSEVNIALSSLLIRGLLVERLGKIARV